MAIPTTPTPLQARSSTDILSSFPLPPPYTPRPTISDQKQESFLDMDVPLAPVPSRFKEILISPTTYTCFALLTFFAFLTWTILISPLANNVHHQPQPSTQAFTSTQSPSLTSTLTFTQHSFPTSTSTPRRLGPQADEWKKWIGPAVLLSISMIASVLHCLMRRRERVVMEKGIKRGKGGV